jgi:hypothetical protein
MDVGGTGEGDASTYTRKHCRLCSPLSSLCLSLPLSAGPCELDGRKGRRACTKRPNALVEKWHSFEQECRAQQVTECTVAERRQ